METQKKKLYRSNQDKILDGVCAGFAEYLDIDPNIVRVTWIAITLLGGAGIILYIAGIIIMPRNPEQSSIVHTPRDHASLAGMIFILIGGLLLLHNMNLLDWFDWHFSWSYLFPLLFILVGGWLLLDYGEKLRDSHREDETASTDTDGIASQPMYDAKRLRRSIEDRKIIGVCGGLASYFEIDSSLVRIVWIVLLFASFGTALLLYFLLGVLLPPELPLQNSSTIGAI